jgi:hypothetical protein
MNIYTNEKLVRRNNRIAQVALLGGLAVLGGGMYISFTRPESFSLSAGALLLGFVLSQIGIYFSNRWGRRPRPDEHLNQALKGLDSKYSLYHYITPSSHLLVGPAGVWALLPKHQRGTITYEKGRIRQRGGGILLGYLKLFAQEGIGRPELEAMSELENLEKYFAKRLENDETPEIKAALVFTNPETQIDIDGDADPPTEVLPVAKLKDFIRKEAKSKPISLTTVEQIQEVMEEEVPVSEPK